LNGSCRHLRILAYCRASLAWSPIRAHSCRSHVMNIFAACSATG